VGDQRRPHLPPDAELTSPVSSRPPAISVGLVCAAGVAGGACLPDGEETPVRTQSAIVYGADDRQEVFEASDTARSAASSALVAFMPRTMVSRTGDGAVAFTAPSLGETNNLCPGEPFADQPAGAFCTGVLVDTDLVLTAAHCVHVLAPRDFVVVFGYYFAAAGMIAATGADVVDAQEIVAERLSRIGDDPRLDYAWVRLARPAPAGRRPVPVHVAPPPLAVGDSLIAISASGGVPLKVDEGGTVRDLRLASSDYLVADTDTSGGSSGGGAFDAQLALVGVLARGGPDLVDTPEGCRTTFHQADATAAEEEFSYAHRAVAGLCAADPTASSLCRSDCGSPCLALPPRQDTSGGGCSIADGQPGDRSATSPVAPGTWASLAFLLAGCALSFTRRKLKRVHFDI
jgi:S1-C subfamily serine protease